MTNAECSAAVQSARAMSRMRNRCPKCRTEDNGARMKDDKSFPFPVFPKLRTAQVAVACVEAQTGIPLNLEGQRHRACGGEVYRVFDSLLEARAFAQRAV